MTAGERLPIDEAEWEAQERGMRAALGKHAGDIGASAASYRTVVELLISHPRSEPPDDFAAGIAASIARHQAGVEPLLSRILLAVFGVVSIVVIAVYGSRCWSAFDQRLGDDAMGWVLAAMGCMILSWICSQYRLHVSRTAASESAN